MGLAIGLLLGAILLFWLGTRHRKKVYAEYEDDSQKYTATTTMTLIKQTKSETQRWEDNGDGNQELVTDICYLPTYEYTVNGEVYHYTSRLMDLTPCKSPACSVPAIMNRPIPKISQNISRKNRYLGVSSFLSREWYC